MTPEQILILKRAIRYFGVESQLDKAIARGAIEFKFSGPKSGLRPFCAERLGKTFTVKEILAMNNGQGLPVQYSCGGYNCKHRWTPTKFKTVSQAAA